MEFPNLGEYCSEKSCNQLDFLPLKCNACKAIFCTNHISYIQHSCPSAQERNVQVPICPLCNAPVPSKRGDPPDLAVSLHIENDCKSDHGQNGRKVFANKCSSSGCKTKEIVPVKCSDCNKNYCIKHRHPCDHKCIGKEESMRQKRLNALNKKIMQNNNTGNSSNNFKDFQGHMSEDEALARAVQASLQDQQPVQQSVPWMSRDRCRLS